MRTIERLVAVLVLLAATACGGGDPEPSDEGRVTPPPLNCAEHPELCK